MTSDISKWPNGDPIGKFLFCDGNGTGYNVSFDLVIANGSRELSVRILKIVNDNVVDESDPLILTNQDGVKLEMKKKDPRGFLKFKISKVHVNNNFPNPERGMLDLSGAGASSFDGKFARLLDKTILPGDNPVPSGPACGFIGVTDAREVAQTDSYFMAVNLNPQPDSGPTDYRVKIFFNSGNGELNFYAPQHMKIIYSAPPAPGGHIPQPYPLKFIPVPKWGRRMTVQHI